MRLNFKITPLQKMFRVALLTAASTFALQPFHTVLADVTNQTQVQHYHIPAGSLAQSLNRFASQAGITLTFDPVLVSGKRAAPLNGQFSVATGLARLITDQSLQLINDGDNSYRIEEANMPDSVQLSMLSVAGNKITETGLGHVDGYVARRSITAAKVDIPLIETPQTVSIVTADQITIQNAESLVQALKYTPGIVPMGGDSTTSDGMVIRGFNVTGAAPMYLNGAKLSRNTFSGVSEPYLMERIEILKGPASILYGNAAPGGIVNMVTKQPQTESLRELKLQAGSFDRKQLAGDFAGALTEDGSLSYRLTGLVRRSDTMTDKSPDDRDFGAVSIRWEPTDDTSLTLLGNYQHNDTIYNYGLPEEGTIASNINGHIARDRFVGEPAFDKFSTRNHTLGYLFSHQFNDNLTFRQNLLYFNAKLSERVVSTGRLIEPGRQQLSRSAYVRDSDDITWAIDNQLEVKWQQGQLEHTSLVGLDYHESVFKRTNFRGVAAPLNLYQPAYGSAVIVETLPNSDAKQQADKLGIYAQQHTKIADKLVVMFGGRYDKVKADTKNYLTQTSTENHDDDAFTGRAGLVYLFDNGLAPYISYAESFEASSGTDIRGKAFKPTEGEQYEIGLRYQPEDQDFSITASVYKLTQKNVNTADLNNPGFSVQEGEVESKGFELEARANLTNNLNLIASYGYIDNAVTRSNNGTEGNRQGGVPRHMASVWADYLFTETLPDLSFGAGIRYVGESNNLANTYDVPSHTVVDAVINYTLSPEWKLALNVNNLFDKEYATCSYACFYGVKRSAYLTASYNW